MAKLTYGAITIDFDNNQLLATMQVATARRFAAGKGFFMTAPGVHNNEQVSTSHWVSPASELTFVYDAEDVHGDQVDTVFVDETEVARYLGKMDRPIGITFSYSPDLGRYLPFADEAMRAEVESAPSAGE